MGWGCTTCGNHFFSADPMAGGGTPQPFMHQLE